MVLFLVFWLNIILDIFFIIQANFILCRKFQTPKSERLENVLLSAYRGEILFLTPTKNDTFVTYSQTFNFLIYAIDVVVCICNPMAPEAERGYLPVEG